MSIDCISDLHGYYPKLEGGDLLIVAGDLTATDSYEEYIEFLKWFDESNYIKKIFIAGNHDNNILPITWMNGYLEDSGTEFEGLKIYGSPWTRRFKGMNPKCMAFTVDTEEELMDKFELIPHDTDILITHSPALGILDKRSGGHSVGSSALFAWLKYVERPRLHVFGHIHESHGRQEVFPSYENKMMISVNASHVDSVFDPINKPIRIEL